MEFNKTQIDQLTEDVSYLQDEVEALKYVIHSVPFEEKPAGRESILELVAMIDHAQKVFYRPFVESVAGFAKPEDFIDDEFRKSFSLEMDKIETVDNLLDKIIKHRAALLSVLQKMNIIDWNRKGMVKGRSKTIYIVITEMVEFERNQLKMVAERVISLERDRQF
ncbi:MAG: hypothetical protein GW823_05860 [Bacteroidetes bacterium]|nr:hypothetical protein [Bacteroidota bacterium]